MGSNIPSKNYWNVSEKCADFKEEWNVVWTRVDIIVLPLIIRFNNDVDILINLIRLEDAAGVQAASLKKSEIDTNDNLARKKQTKSFLTKFVGIYNQHAMYLTKSKL